LATGLLLLVSLTAAFLPAQRASRLDPWPHCARSERLALGLHSRLYSVVPQDQLTLALATGLLLLVSLTAAFLPAQRASRLDPMAALRQE